MLDAILAVLLLAGLILGGALGARKSFALAVVLVLSLLGAIALAALSALAVEAIFSGSGYFTRTFFFLGSFLGATALGLRYAWNKATGDARKKELPALADRSLGAILGVLSGVAASLFLLLFALQIPSSAPFMASLFLRSGSGQQGRSPSPLRGLVGGLEAALEPARSSLNPNPAAPLLVSAVGGRVAGDHYACYLKAYRGDEVAPLRLYLNCGTVINFYSTRAGYGKSPWLSRSVTVLTAIQSSNEEAVRQKASEVFLNGTLGQMDAMLCALSFSASPGLVRVRYEGDLVRRTLRGARMHREKGDLARARLAYDAFLDLHGRNRYQDRVVRERAAFLGQDLPGRPETGAGPAKPRPDQTQEDVVRLLKSYRYRAAAKTADRILKGGGTQSRGEVGKLLASAHLMAGLHQALLAELKRTGEARLLPIPETGAKAAVVAAFEGSVALKVGGSAKTLAWKSYTPSELLAIYQEVVPGEREGLDAFREFFALP